MRLMLQLYLLITAGGLLLSGCGKSEKWATGKVEAYVPVYSTDPNLKKIVLQSPHSSLQQGKLYAATPGFVFEEEAGQGLHIIDCTNPANPVKAGFISIPGMGTLLIKGDLLYAENYDDLAVISISNLPAVKEVSRIPHIRNEEPYPPYKDIYFQCADTTKGIVTGWEKQLVENPKCRR
jgi:hypothetical protein